MAARQTGSTRSRLPALVAMLGALIAFGALSDATPAPAQGGGAVVPRSFFGVVSQTTLTTPEFTRMGQGQLGTLRTIVNWATIDQTDAPGDDDWSAIDPIAAYAAVNGIQVIPFVFGTPTWVVRDLDGRSCPKRKCGVYAPHKPAAIKEWQRFLAEAVLRYGPNGQFWQEHPEFPEVPITTWQLWNEQNSPTFYKPRVDAKAYAKLVAAGYDAIRFFDPTARVLLGGMFGTPGGTKKKKLYAWNYLRKLYSVPGFADHFTGVAAHPYSARLGKVKQQVKLLHREVTRAGDDAEMWITEVGWSSGRGKNPLERGKQGQASRLRDAMRWFIRKATAFRIQNVTWFAWRDLAGKPICKWCANAGLFKAKRLAAKPAWKALMAFTGGS